MPDTRHTRDISERASRLLSLVALLLALPGAAQAAMYYVDANRLNCREAPRTNAPVVQVLNRGQRVDALTFQSDWAKVAPDDASACWASSRYLATTPPPSPLIGTVNVGRSKPAPRRQSRPATAPRSLSSAYSGSGCPCSGYNNCFGPRGGRYCITSGGNKRYR